MLTISRYTHIYSVSHRILFFFYLVWFSVFFRFLQFNVMIDDTRYHGAASYTRTNTCYIVGCSLNGEFFHFFYSMVQQIHNIKHCSCFVAADDALTIACSDFFILYLSLSPFHTHTLLLRALSPHLIAHTKWKTNIVSSNDLRDKNCFIGALLLCILIGGGRENKKKA